MSQPSSQSAQQASSLQKSQSLAQQSQQSSSTAHGQSDPSPSDKQKEQDNDYQCEFKLVIKQKFQQKLKHDQTDCVFTVIINEIIEERIRKNYYGEEQTIPSAPKPVAAIQDLEQQILQTKNVSSQLQRIKAEKEQVDKRIQQLRKRRPKKKGLTYELDPNRDHGFILGKKMAQANQERQKKYLQNKIQLESHKNQLIQGQMSTIACIQSFSMHLATKGNRRYSKEVGDSYKLPKIPHQNNFLNETDKFNRSRLGFNDAIAKNKNSVDETPQKIPSFSSQKYQSMVLSARSNYESVKKDKKRDLLRQIEILKKSQKITEKYQTRKMACDILINVIFNAVKLVETKKEFYFNAPPKPVHEMIRNYKDKNGKTVWIPGSKPENFRINLYQKQSRREKSEANKSQVSANMEEERDGSVVKNITRISRVSQTIDLCINSKTDKSEGSLDDNESGKEREVSREENGNSENEGNDETESKKEGEQIDEIEENKGETIQANQHNPQIPIYL